MYLDFYNKYRDDCVLINQSLNLTISVAAEGSLSSKKKLFNQLSSNNYSIIFVYY